MPPPEARPHLTLIRGAEVYTPAPVGQQSLLLLQDVIAYIGTVPEDWLDQSPLEVRVVDASGCLVLPGFIDPHQHLAGGAGEQGFGSRTLEVSLAEILSGGATTVVGCLGTDILTRGLPALLARARQLEEQGLSTYIYTGGFPVPPPTFTGSVANDLVLIDKVIGVGEVAIADVRSSQPTLPELANLVSEALIGGTLGGKAGLTHFHLGTGRGRLRMVRALLDDYEIPPRHLYPTHVNRSEALMDEAIDLARRGCFVDVDTVDEDPPTGYWLRYYLEHGGPPGQLTFSSDAHTSGGTAAQRYEAFAQCIREDGLPLAQVLPCFTANVSAVLCLEHKGRLEPGASADLLLVDAETLAIRDVFARGRRVVREGQVNAG